MTETYLIILHSIVQGKKILCEVIFVIWEFFGSFVHIIKVNEFHSIVESLSLFLHFFTMFSISLIEVAVSLVSLLLKVFMVVVGC